jgi:hypothetical protein
MAFLNESGTLGFLILEFTNNVTGSLFITMLLLIISLMALTMLFRIPLEYSMVYILPLLLVLMAYSSEFLVIGTVVLLYLAIIMAKMWILR